MSIDNINSKLRYILNILLRKSNILHKSNILIILLSIRIRDSDSMNTCYNLVRRITIWNYEFHYNSIYNFIICNNLYFYTKYLIKYYNKIIIKYYKFLYKLIIVYNFIMYNKIIYYIKYLKNHNIQNTY